MSNGNDRDPDDFFAETRMSFGDHIEELRHHLFKAITGFVVALIFSFFIGQPVLSFITAPVQNELQAFNNRRLAHKKKALANNPEQKINQPSDFTQLGFRRDQLDDLFKGKPNAEINAFKKPFVVKPADAQSAQWPAWMRWLGFSSAGEEQKQLGPNDEAINEDQIVKIWVRHEHPADEASRLLPAIRDMGELDTLATLNVTEAFMVYFKVCMLCALVLGSPWIFYQIWAFVAAGLYPNEKKLVHVYLPVSLGLFLGGVFMCQFFVIPKAIEALLWFNEWIGLKPDLRLNEWLGFAIMLPVVFGISFQTPLVMMFLDRIGIMTVHTFRSYRRIAWFCLAVFAAVITPTPDAVSMLMLWVPISLLYELGIILIALTPKPEFVTEDEEEGKLVEV